MHSNSGFVIDFACLAAPPSGKVRAEWSLRNSRSSVCSGPLGGAVSGQSPESEQLLTPSEVAALFRVDPKTVTRWAKAGKLNSIRTLGGHRRYRASEVHALLEAQSPASSVPASPHVPPPGIPPLR